jgi:hypothetical protein
MLPIRLPRLAANIHFWMLLRRFVVRFLVERVLQEVVFEEQMGLAETLALPLVLLELELASQE